MLTYWPHAYFCSDTGVLSVLVKNGSVSTTVKFGVIVNQNNVSIRNYLILPTTKMRQYMPCSIKFLSGKKKIESRSLAQTSLSRACAICKYVEGQLMPTLSVCVWVDESG